MVQARGGAGPDVQDRESRLKVEASHSSRAKGERSGLLLLLDWLIPGAGFWLRGRRTRGAIQFLLVMVTFVLGLALHSGVAWPSWTPGAADFNLINNFTFIIQMGAGLPALVSLAAQFISALPAWAQPIVQSTHLTVLAGAPPHPYYELGSYYLIVAGAINYFAVCNLHDRILHRQARYQAQEEEEKETPAPS
jgi:hypothetical protein